MIKKLGYRWVTALLILIFIASILGACSQPAPAPSSAPAPAPSTSAAAKPAPSTSAAPAPAPATSQAPAAKVEPVVFKTVTFLPTNQSRVEFYREFTRRVATATNGELTIQIIGGPEVVSLFDMGTAIKNGVIDGAWLYTPAYSGLAMAPSLLKWSRMNAQEERSSGFIDALQEVHAPVGLFYLGRGTATPPGGIMNLFLKKSAHYLKELKGVKVAVTFDIPNAAKTLGMVPVFVQASDCYTALERGMVDAYSFPLDETLDYSLYEQVKYVVDAPYQADTVSTIFNLSRWNKLPKRVQDAVMAVQLDMEKGYFNDQIVTHAAAIKKKLVASGIEFIRWSDPDIKTLYDAVYGVEANIWLSKMDPTQAAKFKKLLGL